MGSSGGGSSGGASGSTAAEATVAVTRVDEEEEDDDDEEAVARAEEEAPLLLLRAPLAVGGAVGRSELAAPALDALPEAAVEEAAEEAEVEEAEEAEAEAEEEEAEAEARDAVEGEVGGRVAVEKSESLCGLCAHAVAKAVEVKGGVEVAVEKEEGVGPPKPLNGAPKASKAAAEVDSKAEPLSSEKPVQRVPPLERLLGAKSGSDRWY